MVTALLSDPDLTSLTAFYEWYQNGQLTNVTGDTVYAADTQANDEWRVVVTPNDGYANGLSQPPSLWRTLLEHFKYYPIALGIRL